MVVAVTNEPYHDDREVIDLTADGTNENNEQDEDEMSYVVEQDGSGEINFIQTRSNKRKRHDDHYEGDDETASSQTSAFSPPPRNIQHYEQDEYDLPDDESYNEGREAKRPQVTAFVSRFVRPGTLKADVDAFVTDFLRYIEFENIIQGVMIV